MAKERELVKNDSYLWVTQLDIELEEGAPKDKNEKGM